MPAILANNKIKSPESSCVSVVCGMAAICIWGAELGIEITLPPDISYVTWSANGISVFYKGAMVVHLSAEDMYPLAVPAKAVPLVASELRNMAARAN